MDGSNTDGREGTVVDVVERIINVRTDTVSSPSPQMMVRALQDWNNETVEATLESEVAGLLNKEAAVWMPSGTMANLASILTLAPPGSAVIAESQTHLVHFEREAVERLGGATVIPLLGTGGMITEEVLQQQLSVVQGRMVLVVFENPHTRAGGAVLDATAMIKTMQTARRYGALIHLDAARFFNAAERVGVSLHLMESCDTVMISLSKALGAPLGAMLAGRAEYIQRARHWRRLLGGDVKGRAGWASAGLTALKSTTHIQTDHRRAETLRTMLQTIPGLRIQELTHPINIILIDVSETGQTAHEFQSALAQQGVRVSVHSASIIRIVLHKDIVDNDLNLISLAIRTVCRRVR